MKKLLILVCVITLTSCDQKKTVKEIPVSKEKNYQYLKFEYHSVNIYEYRMKDGCQYIGYMGPGDTRDYFLTHKGLCDNPKHKQ